ncbi:S-methyl-5-thioribose-1-phosphate isomerase [candidate division TA06 bacterium]|nr:S-methyl-5-thioribose-1-phosphate isomerase [candidate division TA06 bacterium]
MIKSIQWRGNGVRIIDQTRLPEELVYLDLKTVEEMVEAILTLRIRGAPLLGVAGAFGVVLAASNHHSIEEAIRLLTSTRPTAVNLFKALERMRRVSNLSSRSKLKTRLLEEALAIEREDEELCRRIGENGQVLLGEKMNILTHCNTGLLATAGWGTALGVVYAAKSKGKEMKIYVSETRPLLQGSRLTAWELNQNGIPVVLLSEGASGSLLKKGGVDAIIVGADRIVQNGDVANKIGTYPLSLLAKEHRIPFYVAAPSTTFDPSLQTGDEIPIEERGGEEIKEIFGHRVAPEGVAVYNPAFDITPSDKITAIITEKGILYPPFQESIQKMNFGTTRLHEINTEKKIILKIRV